MTVANAPAMPSDAMTALQCLAGQLGRAPTLDELYRFVRPPGGTVAPPTSGLPAAQSDPRVELRDMDTGGPLLLRQAAGESLDPISAQLRANEILDMTPELRAAREDWVRRVLFGLAGTGMAGPFGPGGPFGGGGAFGGANPFAGDVQGTLTGPRGIG